MTDKAKPEDDLLVKQALQLKDREEKAIFFSVFGVVIGGIAIAILRYFHLPTHPFEIVCIAFAVLWFIVMLPYALEQTKEAKAFKRAHPKEFFAAEQYLAQPPYKQP